VSGSGEGKCHLVFPEEGRHDILDATAGRKHGEDLSTNFNEVLLKKGYARVDNKYLPKDLEYYQELQDGARKKEIRIWAGKGTEPGEDSR